MISFLLFATYPSLQATDHTVTSTAQGFQSWVSFFLMSNDLKLKDMQRQKNQRHQRCLSMNFSAIAVRWSFFMKGRL
jgi:hypothetical protein